MTTTVTVTSSLNPSKICQDVIFTATASTTLTTTGITTGYIIFYFNGQNGTQPIAVNGSGVATYTRKFRCSSTVTVSAIYVPTIDTGTLTQTITKKKKCC
jgi:hypothetical protein